MARLIFVRSGGNSELAFNH